jgi:MoaA/NifB/PqqE/SkfB family radical SAM enzyme
VLNPERLVEIYRRIQNRKVKVLALETLRRLGMRHLVIRMDTINLCNLRCKMCYYSSDYLRKKDEMDLAFFRKIADQIFPKTRFLYLSCATEPTMNKHFADIVAATGEYKVPFTSFCTNGQLLTKEIVQASINAKLSEIIFSVDGACAETYEHIRRGGKWGRLLEKMDMLADMRRQANTQYPKTRVNFTCMERNIRELPAMVQFAAEHGGSSLHVRHLLSYTDEANTCKEEMAYVRSFNAAAQEARKEATSRGIDIFLPDPVPERTALGKTCFTDGSKNLESEANPYCVLPWFSGIISWQGDYRICSTHRVGSLREQTFEQIYNGPKMREIRNKMLWRKTDACSWKCREEAYDVPDQVAGEEPAELVGISPSPEN